MWLLRKVLDRTEKCRFSSLTTWLVKFKKYELQKKQKKKQNKKKKKKKKKDSVNETVPDRQRSKKATLCLTAITSFDIYKIL